MKLTPNRKHILQALSEYLTESEGPPHSARYVGYILRDVFNTEGYPDLKTIPNKNQIHRTLRDLWAAGLIVGMRFKEESYDGGLPSWVIRYQVAADIAKNALIADCLSIHGKIKTAKFGVCGAYKGLPADEVIEASKEVSRLLALVQDKSFSDSSKLLLECQKWLNDGIPEPV